ncbi:MAG: hypothetical protein JNL21_30920 [Myxococcales bacterium]|nr:hypothetical protein [Myxococcales bacterium]
MRAGPGLAKIRRVPLTLKREKHLVAVTYGPIRAWLEQADVISEGAVDAGPPPTYFGTTSILLAWAGTQDTRWGATPLERQMLAIDPHLRVRALRVAREEAELRADGHLGALRAEVEIESSARGLTLRVDVEASVYARRAALRT